jgi:uncharacterized protein YutD
VNRAKIQDYIDQREEQRVDLYHYERQTDDEFLLNGHQYKLLKNYREGFDGDQLANRFSNILNKYDYIVGDWGYDQLRLKGFYDSANPLFRPEQGVDTIEDYLFEDCNFGCPYFIVQNCEVQLPRHRNRRHRKSHSPVIKERKRKVKQPEPRKRHNQTAKRVKTGSHRQKFVIHQRTKRKQNEK